MLFSYLIIDSAIVKIEKEESKYFLTKTSLKTAPPFVSLLKKDFLGLPLSLSRSCPLLNWVLYTFSLRPVSTGYLIIVCITKKNAEKTIVKIESEKLKDFLTKKFLNVSHWRRSGFFINSEHISHLVLVFLLLTLNL